MARRAPRDRGLWAVAGLTVLASGCSSAHARSAELLVGRGGHGRPRRHGARRAAADDPGDRVDAAAVLPPRVGLGAASGAARSPCARSRRSRGSPRFRSRTRRARRSWGDVRGSPRPHSSPSIRCSSGIRRRHGRTPWSFLSRRRRSGGSDAWCDDRARSAQPPGLSWRPRCSRRTTSPAYLVLAERVVLLVLRRRFRAAWLAAGGVVVAALALAPLALTQRAAGSGDYIASSSLGSRLTNLVKQFLVGRDAPLDRGAAVVAALLVSRGACLRFPSSCVADGRVARGGRSDGARRCASRRGSRCGLRQHAERACCLRSACGGSRRSRRCVPAWGGRARSARVVRRPLARARRRSRTRSCRCGSTFPLRAPSTVASATTARSVRVH